MKKLLLGMIVCVVLAVSMALATDFDAPWYGTFTGGSGTVTNTTGWPVTLSSVQLSVSAGQFGSSNVTIKIIRNASTGILQRASATNTVVYDANDSVRVPRNGWLEFSTPWTGTVWYTVNTKR